MSQTLTFRAPFATMKNCSLTIEQNQKTLRATMDAMADLSEEQKAELSADLANVVLVKHLNNQIVVFH